MRIACPLAIVFATLAGANGALAQSNVLFVEQSGPGNLLSVDQSQARDSVVGSASAPVAQTGGFNTLSITDAGAGNALPAITQDNRTGSALDANIASIVLGSGTNGAQVNLVQGALNGGALSGNNVAIIDLVQGDAAGIVQNGANNQAAVTVTGAGSSGLVTQTGNANAGALTVIGVGTAATLTQTGNGLTSTGVAPGTDFTNGAPVGISIVANGVPVDIIQGGN